MLGSGVVQRAIPASSADGVNRTQRFDPFGAAFTREEIRSWADEGSYFRCCNATFGTGIAQSIQTTFSALNAVAVLRNTSASKIIIPHYLRLINTVAGATSTSGQLGIVLDIINRYSSGGTDLTANIVNATTEAGLGASVADLRFGALTMIAASSPRPVARSSLKTQAAPCWVVGDEVLITFNGNDPDRGLASGAAASRFGVNTGPCILRGQNHSMLVHLWNPANATTAPSWEIEFAWWER